MNIGRNYDFSGSPDLERKISTAVFDLYFTVLKERTDPFSDREMNSAIYASCRTILSEAGISDKTLDMFELMFPLLGGEQ